MRSIRKQFEKWAKCYYSGFEGGNLKAPYWFCGIEYGGEFKFNKIEQFVVGDSMTETFKCIKGNKIPYWEENHDKGYRYSEKVAKFVCLMKEGVIDNWRQHRGNLYTRDGDTFKMNLFPINFLKDKDELWTEEYQKRLEFNDKPEYRDWCKENRSPFLNNIVVINKPRLLICTAKTYKKLYKDTFLEKDRTLKEHTLKETYYSAKRRDSGTVVIITPFFGKGGIMEDSDYVELSNLAKELLKGSE